MKDDFDAIVGPASSNEPDAGFLPGFSQSQAILDNGLQATIAIDFQINVARILASHVDLASGNGKPNRSAFVFDIDGLGVGHGVGFPRLDSAQSPFAGAKRLNGSTVEPLKPGKGFRQVKAQTSLEPENLLE
jgi:hypothetical protein